MLSINFILFIHLYLYTCTWLRPLSMRLEGVKSQACTCIHMALILTISQCVCVCVVYLSRNDRLTVLKLNQCSILFILHTKWEHFYLKIFHAKMMLLLSESVCENIKYKVLILFFFPIPSSPLQGKFIRINFDQSGYIAGANIETCMYCLFIIKLL